MQLNNKDAFLFAAGPWDLYMPGLKYMSLTLLYAIIAFMKDEQTKMRGTYFRKKVQAHINVCIVCGKRLTLVGLILSVEN